MKTKLRRIAALIICVSALLSALLISGCNKDDGNKPDPKETGALTEAQKANVLALSEAFIESGKIYNGDNALAVKDIESFIYYLYNGELTAEEDGYASVSNKDAMERIKMYFGISSILHTFKNSTDQDYYYSGERYYLKTNAPFVTSSEIVSAKQNEDGNYDVSVRAACVDGARVELEFVFKLEGDATRVLSCMRYDEK